MAMPAYNGYETVDVARQRSRRTFYCLAPFHGAGVSLALFDSILNDVTLVMAPTTAPWNAQTFCDVLDAANVQQAAMLPHVIEDVSRSSEALKRLSTLDCVLWLGGPISQLAGDTVSRHTTLYSIYGSSETAIPVHLTKDDPTSDWTYCHFHPTENSYDFRPVPGSSDGLFELFVTRSPPTHPTPPSRVFQVYPDQAEWPMKDLFAPHPSKPNHWRLIGRADDLITFIDGQKLNPRNVEDAIRSADGVRDVLMFGAGYYLASIIVEPTEQEAQKRGQPGWKDDFLAGLWPVVERSNAKAPLKGQLSRELVMLTPEGKPFPRTGKGTIKKAEARELYKQDVASMYARLPESKRVQDWRIGAGDAAH
ncbi:MAG: hypothetical protein Q9162_001749 [Coniocarpon cinnabarinum]